MRQFLNNLGGLVLLAALCLGIGYLVGDHQATTAATAAQAKTAIEAHKLYNAEVDRGQAAAAKSLSNQREQEARYADLEIRFTQLRQRVPLVRSNGSAGGAGCVAAVRPAANHAATLDGSTAGSIALPAPDPTLGQPQAGPSPTAGTSADAVPALTLAAVRMWNSALAGTDLATGACRADATAEQANAAAGAISDAEATACADSAGLTVDDAWHNHTINAQSCAADRLRLQALIDFIGNRQGNTRRNLQ